MKSPTFHRIKKRPFTDEDLKQEERILDELLSSSSESDTSEESRYLTDEGCDSSEEPNEEASEEASDETNEEESSEEASDETNEEESSEEASEETSEDEKDELEKALDALPDPEEIPYHPELGWLADEGALTPEVLNDYSFTDALRIGTYNDFARNTLANLGWSPLPLIRGGEQNPYQILPHQEETIRWMREKEGQNYQGICGGLLNLEMGLGKTLTAMSYILISKLRDEGKPTLVIMSKTIMNEWYFQAKQFFGNKVKILFFHKDFMGEEFKCFSPDEFASYDFVTTTYDVALDAFKAGDFNSDVCELGQEGIHKDKVLAIHPRRIDHIAEARERLGEENVGRVGLYTTIWARVICDESQKFANPKTKIYRAMMGLYSHSKFSLSGTPIRNYDTDIWAQLRFLGFTTIKYAKQWSGEMMSVKQRVVAYATFSRNYQEANVVIPPKQVVYHDLELTGKALEVYKAFLNATKEALDNFMQGLVTWDCVLVLFLRLRQCAVAPYLITQTDGEGLSFESILGEKSPLTEFVMDKSGEAGIKSVKISKIVRIISELPQTEKVVIFSNFTAILDLVGEALEEAKKEGFVGEIVRLDGSMKTDARQISLARFKKDPKVRVFLATYKVAGEGLNLVVARHCISVEPWWNSATHEQAEKRIHRPGQTMETFAHRIRITNTIETPILDLCERKRQMAENYLRRTSHKLVNAKLDLKTLRSMLGV